MTGNILERKFGMNPNPYQAPGPMPPQWQPMPPQKPQNNGTSGLAIASLVLGIVGLLLHFICLTFISVFLCILGFIFGLVSLRSSLKGMAVAGVILNSISLAICLIVFLVFFGMVGSMDSTDFNYFLYDLGNLLGGGYYY